MIGGEGERLMLPLIGRLADWWNVGAKAPEAYRHKRDIVYRHAEATGRDPAGIVQTMMLERRLPSTRFGIESS
jgi:alkanesulfonate monooxygenase SsuD/methylene tetrahydromethanopterin reductase-like flavin-dependent oxidoreductase (luciferase family)